MATATQLANVDYYQVVVLGGKQHEAAIGHVAVDLINLIHLSTATDGSTAWTFSSPKKTAAEHIVVNADNSMPSLEQAIAQLPLDIGAKKAAQLLRERHPDLVFNAKDLREALGAAKASPSTTSSSTSILETAPPSGISHRLDEFAHNFCIRGTPVSGLGAYATRNLKRGERILAEAPLVEWTIKEGEAVSTVGIDNLVASLSQVDRDDYFGLCQNDMHGPIKTAYGVWLSNAFPTDSPLQAARDKLSGTTRSEKRGAVFAGFCRFNHSCNPNSHTAWNERLGKQTIHTLRDIAKGEAITVSYLPDVGTATKQRGQRLFDDFGFRCACNACSLTGTLRAESDERRTRVGELAALMEVAVNGTGGAALNLPGRKRTNAIALVEERLGLMTLEGTEHTSWDTLYAACAYCRSVGDKVEASQWASRAAEMARLALGKDSDEYQQYAACIGRRSGAKQGK